MENTEREDGFYLINDKRILYWQQGEWWTPLKYVGRYTGNISRLDKQPKIIKSIEKLNIRC
jgi:hypothetical protein